MKNEGIQFGAARKYCSRADRVSICMLETLRHVFLYLDLERFRQSMII